MTTSMRVVVLDHYDSYTWNLAHLIAEVTGVLPVVVPHDVVTMADLRAYDRIILSAGPGHPEDEAGRSLCLDILRAARRPVLGVCLGMQELVVAFGGRIGRVNPVHGEVSEILHDSQGVFHGLPQQLPVVRYHSLAAIEVPEDLRISARAPDGTVMGVRHHVLPVEGVQFHPESVLSVGGSVMIGNFLRQEAAA